MQEKSHLKIVIDNSNDEEIKKQHSKQTVSNPIYGNFLAFKGKIEQKKSKMKDFFDGLF